MLTPLGLAKTKLGNDSLHACHHSLFGFFKRNVAFSCYEEAIHAAAANETKDPARVLKSVSEGMRMRLASLHGGQAASSLLDEDPSPPHMVNPVINLNKMAQAALENVLALAEFKAEGSVSTETKQHRFVPADMGRLLPYFYAMPVEALIAWSTSNKTYSKSLMQLLEILLAFPDWWTLAQIMIAAFIEVEQGLQVLISAFTMGSGVRKTPMLTHTDVTRLIMSRPLQCAASLQAADGYASNAVYHLWKSVLMAPSSQSLMFHRNVKHNSQVKELLCTHLATMLEVPSATDVSVRSSSHGFLDPQSSHWLLRKPGHRRVSTALLERYRLDRLLILNQWLLRRGILVSIKRVQNRPFPQPLLSRVRQVSGQIQYMTRDQYLPGILRWVRAEEWIDVPRQLQKHPSWWDVHKASEIQMATRPPRPEELIVAVSNQQARLLSHTSTPPSTHIPDQVRRASAIVIDETWKLKEGQRRPPDMSDANEAFTESETEANPPDSVGTGVLYRPEYILKISGTLCISTLQFLCCQETQSLSSQLLTSSPLASTTSFKTSQDLLELVVCEAIQCFSVTNKLELTAALSDVRVCLHGNEDVQVILRSVTPVMTFSELFPDQSTVCGADLSWADDTHSRHTHTSTQLSTHTQMSTQLSPLISSEEDFPSLRFPSSIEKVCDVPKSLMLSPATSEVKTITDWKSGRDVFGYSSFSVGNPPLSPGVSSHMCDTIQGDTHPPRRFDSDGGLWAPKRTYSSEGHYTPPRVSCDTSPNGRSPVTSQESLHNKGKSKNTWINVVITPSHTPHNGAALELSGPLSIRLESNLSDLEVSAVPPLMQKVLKDYLSRLNSVINEGHQTEQERVATLFRVYSRLLWKGASLGQTPALMKQLLEASTFWQDRFAKLLGRIDKMSECLSSDNPPPLPKRILTPQTIRSGFINIRCQLPSLTILTTDGNISMRLPRKLLQLDIGRSPDEDKLRLFRISSNHAVLLTVKQSVAGWEQCLQTFADELNTLWDPIHTCWFAHIDTVSPTVSEVNQARSVLRDTLL
eukprot:Blabericola_migrator_1__7176@NODE_363_length_9424_cov_115_493427_g284_i1_p1_GENE_NODE_363_length_9424_cov_115_493427_g284_i1NODE_363_length_9424_cov_115_493427_g284_i1_p1_ORF_typecomplete_len1082_score245_35_NODE_363_length_9424_cov_115_493427_g284_i11403247